MLNFLFIVFVILFVSPYIIRWIAPFLMKYFFKRMEKNMHHNEFPNMGDAMNPPTEDQFPEEEKNRSQKPTKEELGDYVDFEEVDENK